MAVVRTPISLKFDDDTSSFYVNLIAPLKDNKELSTFTLDLLKLYYENEEVRDALDRYREEHSPINLIQKQITRIAVNHQNNMMTTGMIGDMLSDAKDSFSNKNNTMGSSNTNSNNSELANKVNELDEKVDKISKMLEQIVSNDKSQNIANANVKHESGLNLIEEDTSVKVEKTVEEVNIEASPILRDNSSDNQTNGSNLGYKEETNNSPKVEKVEISTPITSTPEILFEVEKEDEVLKPVKTDSVAPEIFFESESTDDNSSTSDNSSTKTVSSFGKLMGSLKK